MADEAVLDKETGLVWQRSPSSTPDTWFNVIFQCYRETIGGRRGWRLPTVEELMTLLDGTAPSIALPAGNPFSNVQTSETYWTYTGAGADFAWVVGFSPPGGLTARAKSDSTHFRWCVRGGHGYDDRKGTVP
jgi:hypothetical protein